jgi:hypothetical protein
LYGDDFRFSNSHEFWKADQAMRIAKTSATNSDIDFKWLVVDVFMIFFC